MAKAPRIPNPLLFEGLGLCFWSGTPEFRKPEKNEYFVSGAVMTGYRAATDLTSEYWIVKPSHYAMHTTTYQRIGPIEFTKDGIGIPRRRGHV